MTEKNNDRNESDKGGVSERSESPPLSPNDCSSLEPINRLLCQTGNSDDDTEAVPSLLDAEDEDDNDEFTEESCIEDPNRRIWVVTTAALPWFTGTAVNPLLRALYLTRGRPKHHVTLVIPWLSNKQSRERLYKGKSFQSKQDQEQWIRTYCRERAHCHQEETNLRIQFFDSEYQPFFGSIFPTVDICATIPDEEADVVILEEPEHLNWFRNPERKAISKTNSNDETRWSQNSLEDLTENKKDKAEERAAIRAARLGWAHKFRHSVGILHTNYSAYMKEYAIGTGFITAPALGTLSSIVVRAYCHRVIRLSPTLPSLAKNKEVTCNVHGVRAEFQMPKITPESDSEEINYAPVYFIGKIIWAKGFDKLLEVQDLFRKETGAYFQIDVYGAGNDEKSISRAFFGRRKRRPQLIEKEHTPSKRDLRAARFFRSQKSLRRQLLQDEISEPSAIEVIRTVSGRSESIQEERVDQHRSTTTFESGESDEGEETDDNDEVDYEDQMGAHPFSIVSDLSEKSVKTGLRATKAVYRLTDSMVKAGLSMAFTLEKKNETDERRSVKFDPPKTRYEWRRNPIPAKFKGVVDHAELRHIREHKIFLNMSTTEVLCTTTAEALAMGKFAIIPDHPSNQFFLQFTNCLAYQNHEDCLQKLQFALQNEPKELSEDESRKFSWEGANERLFQAAGVTKKEARKRIAKGWDKADKDICKFHSDFSRGGHFLSNIFSNNQEEEAQVDQDESPVHESLLWITQIKT